MSWATQARDFFRAQWGAVFDDTCTIARTTSRGTFNESTLQYDAPSTSSVYSGECQVRLVSRGEASTDFGQEERSILDVEVRIPYTETGVQVDDVVTVTGTSDPQLTSLTCVVREIHVDTYVTRRTLICDLDMGSGALD